MRVRRFPPIALLLLAACANSPMTETGFLDDYQGLRPSPEWQVPGVPDGVFLDLAEGYQPQDYDAVLIEPVVFSQTDQVEFEPEWEEKVELAAYFTEQLRQTLGADYELIDQPRPGALRVRAAITSVNPIHVWTNIVMVVLLVPSDMGGISGEMEVTDAISGQRVAALTTCRDGTPFLILECFSRFGHARHGMEKWSVMLSRILGA
jgi:uncharacterized protein DUF3313